MSGIRISQLPSLTTVTDDDTLIINDANSTTAKITYASFKAGLTTDIVGVSSVNGQTGDVVISAASLNTYTTTEVDVALASKATYSLVGVADGAQDLGVFINGIIPANSTVFGALQVLETTLNGQLNQGGLLSTDNTWTGLNTFDGKVISGAVNNIIRFYFDSQVDFPSATDFHGAIAHSHADGAMYFAHGGVWVKMANASDVAGGTDLSDTYTLLGVTEGVLDLGTFTNNPTYPSSLAQISDNASVKVALQDLSNAVVTNNQLTVGHISDTYNVVGVPLGQLHLGTFSGTTITDDSVVKVALQELETAVEAVTTGGFSGSYNDLTDKPTLGSSAATDSTDYATAAQGALADSALQDASVFATSSQGALADTALQDASVFATSSQGALADSALQAADIGVSVQAYDTNTVVDASYSTVQSGAASGATAVQAAADAITVTTLPVDGTATVDILATAINTLTAELAAILNA